jgi:hypothetical protein
MNAQAKLLLQNAKKQANAAGARVSSLTVAEAAIRKKEAESKRPKSGLEVRDRCTSNLCNQTASRCAHYTEKARDWLILSANISKSRD